MSSSSKRQNLGPETVSVGGVHGFDDDESFSKYSVCFGDGIVHDLSPHILKCIPLLQSIIDSLNEESNNDCNAVCLKDRDSCSSHADGKKKKKNKKRIWQHAPVTAIDPIDLKMLTHHQHRFSAGDLMHRVWPVVRYAMTPASTIVDMLSPYCEEDDIQPGQLLDLYWFCRQVKQFDLCTFIEHVQPKILNKVSLPKRHPAAQKIIKDSCSSSSSTFTLRQRLECLADAYPHTAVKTGFTTNFQDFSDGFFGDDFKLPANAVVAGGALTTVVPNSKQYKAMDLDIWILAGQRQQITAQILIMRMRTVGLEVGSIGKSIVVGARVGRRTIQIILTSCDSADEVIRGFDFNYIRAYWRKHDVFATAGAILDWMDLCCSDAGSKDNNVHFERTRRRLIKAHLKGFDISASGIVVSNIHPSEKTQILDKVLVQSHQSVRKQLFYLFNAQHIEKNQAVQMVLMNAWSSYPMLPSTTATTQDAKAGIHAIFSTSSSSKLLFENARLLIPAEALDFNKHLDLGSTMMVHQEEKVREHMKMWKVSRRIWRKDTLDPLLVRLTGGGIILFNNDNDDHVRASFECASDQEERALIRIQEEHFPGAKIRFVDRPHVDLYNIYGMPPGTAFQKRKLHFTWNRPRFPITDFTYQRKWKSMTLHFTHVFGRIRWGLWRWNLARPSLLEIEFE